MSFLDERKNYDVEWTNGWMDGGMTESKDERRDDEWTDKWMDGGMTWDLNERMYNDLKEQVDEWM